MPFQLHERVQELRREIAEITVADKEKRLSGPEKVKHENRIQRLQQLELLRQSGGLMPAGGYVGAEVRASAF